MLRLRETYGPEWPQRVMDEIERGTLQNGRFDRQNGAGAKRAYADGAVAGSDQRRATETVAGEEGDSISDRWIREFSYAIEEIKFDDGV